MPDPDAPCSYVRASYSLASDEQIDQVSECMNACVNVYQWLFCLLLNAVKYTCNASS